MKIHHLRNATILIETGTDRILVDPMLGAKGESSIPFSFIRFKPKRNPTLDLPVHVMQLIESATHCLITHRHPDHLDKAGIAFLKKHQTPVICSVKDEKTLRSKDLNVVLAVDYWRESEFLGGKIMGVPAVHGYGLVAQFMGNVMGFYLELPDEKTIYLSSDTIYTEDIHNVLNKYKPEITVVPGGAAQLDILKPLLMRMEDLIEFMNDASGKVIVNHLEAVNHCPTTRSQLKAAIQKAGLSDKVYIPEDGEVMVF